MYKIVAAGLLLVPSFALAAVSGDRESVANSNDKGSKMVCREVDETGSRLGGKRVCMTRDQWDEQKRSARSTVEGAQAHQANTCGGATRC